MQRQKPSELKESWAAPEGGGTDWQPDHLQRERAQTVPRESEELPQYGGHGVAFSREGLGQRFSHLALPVQELERSEAWYRDIVGLEVLGRNLTAEERPHSVLRMNSGQLLILVESEDFHTVRPGSTGVHHAFLTTPNQYRRMMDRLKARGLSIVDIRAQFRAHGEYSVNLKDPDGHRIQIQAYGSESHEVILPGTGVVDCGPAASHKVGDVKLFKEGNFFLVRINEGFLALSRWCMHMNGRVVYQKAHWRFWCPYHGATYDRRGTPIGGQPNLCALRLNPISFNNNGHVLVDTDKVIERICFEPGQAVQPSAEAVSETAEPR